MEVEFDNVSLVINRKTPIRKQILKNISFKLKEGKIYSFIGNAGSGKTSICELINGIIYPSSGKVRIGNFINDGTKIKNANLLRFSVGYVSKYKKDMFFNTTVKKELLFGMKYFKYKTNNKVLRATDALKIVGLNESYLNKKIKDLNLNEIKKIQISSVLTFNPKIILLDEPTIYMKSNEKKELMQILRYINQKYKKTIIIMSRDVDFVYKLKEDIFILSGGDTCISGNYTLLENEDKLSLYNLTPPNIVKFTNIAKKRGIDLWYYTDIKDLIKGVCNNVL